VKFGVVVFPGSNCDADVFHLVAGVLKEEAVYLWHQEPDLKGCDCLVLPGGFSYGDYLRVGAIARFSPIMNEVIKFAERGGLVLGICNGFQILVEAGLLPGALMRNADLKFHCHDVELVVSGNASVFTRGLKIGETLSMPVAHGAGNYYAPAEELQKLEDNGQVVFRYRENPNGSVDDIAGISNEEGNVLGLMPHPERAAEPFLGGTDGLKLFRPLLEGGMIR